MGGILVRYYLQQNKLTNLGKVVMLAPANNGSEMLELYRHNPVLASWLGPSLQQSGLEGHCFSCQLNPVVDYEVGIIAGYVPMDPLSWFTIQKPHDGKA